MANNCPRCGSAKIARGIPLLDRFGEFGEQQASTAVTVHGRPEAWMFKDGAAGNVTADICGECGHADFRVSNFRELYEKYVSSRDDIEESIVCLACGHELPERRSTCPECGWSYETTDEA